MRRYNKDIPSRPARVTNCGAITPVENLELVNRQIHEAHRYYNKWVELERRRRNEHAAILRQYFPQLEQVDAELVERQAAEAAAEAAITRVRQNNRMRVIGTPEQKATLAAAKVARQATYAAKKALEREAREHAAVIADNEAMENAHELRLKAASRETSLQWGTKGHVAASLSKIRCGAPPNFRRWLPGGDNANPGHLYVQVQGGLTPEALFACGDTRIRLERVTRDRHGNPKIRYAKNTERAILWFRIGSAGPGGRQPIWTKIPMTLQMDMLARLHPDVKLYGVHVLRRPLGTSCRWRVQLVWGCDAGFHHGDQADSGAVGVDVGYRLLPEGLRVAVAIGDDGARHELILTHEQLRRYHYEKDLRSIRDLHFNTARLQLLRWLETDPPMTDEWRERTAYLAQWRSPNRFRRLVDFWRENRIPGDETLFAEFMRAWQSQEEAAGWHPHDRHVTRTQDYIREQYYNWRKNAYRHFAKLLSCRYRTVYTEDLDLRKLAKKAPVEQDDGKVQKVESQRQMAAVGSLLSAIRQRAAVSILRDPAWTTQACNTCGHIDNFDAAAELLHCCSRCHETWDQDDNAARNLLYGGPRQLAASTEVST